MRNSTVVSDETGAAREHRAKVRKREIASEKQGATVLAFQRIERSDVGFPADYEQARTIAKEK